MRPRPANRANNTGFPARTPTARLVRDSPGRWGKAVDSCRFRFGPGRPTLPRVEPSDETLPADAAIAPVGLVAVLRHETPEGLAHHDLLIALGEPPADEDRTVPCWRVAVRPDLAAPDSRLALERIADHRGLYLRLAEPRRLDRGRGTVTPLRRGTVVASAREADGGERLVIRWRDGGEARWRLVGGALEILATAPRTAERST